MYTFGSLSCVSQGGRRLTKGPTEERDSHSRTHVRGRSSALVSHSFPTAHILFPVTLCIFGTFFGKTDSRETSPTLETRTVFRATRSKKIAESSRLENLSLMIPDRCVRKEEPIWRTERKSHNEQSTAGEREKFQCLTLMKGSEARETRSRTHAREDKRKS